MEHLPAETPAWHETEIVPGLPMWLAIALGIAAIVLLFALVLVVRFAFRREAKSVEPPPVDLNIDVTKLGEKGAPPGPLSVEVYGTPVRIAVVVLAPVGREGAPPTVSEFVRVMEQLVPGFSEAMVRDQPLVRIWPGQLSSQGFANSFFNNVAIPGSRGKGTPWCSLAGKFTALDKSYLTGIVCCGSGSNSLGQYLIQHEGQWNDVLRVKRADG